MAALGQRFKFEAWDGASKIKPAYATVEYWPCDALLPQASPPRLSMTAWHERPRTQARGGRSNVYRGMTCENVTIKGDKGTPITAYVAKPSKQGVQVDKTARTYTDKYRAQENGGRSEETCRSSS